MKSPGDLFLHKARRFYQVPELCVCAGWTCAFLLLQKHFLKESSVNKTCIWCCATTAHVSPSWSPCSPGLSVSSNEMLPGRGWARLLVRSSGCRGSRALLGLEIAADRLGAGCERAAPGLSRPDVGRVSPMPERCCYILLLFLRGIRTAGGVTQPRFLQTPRVQLLLGLRMSPKCPRTPCRHPGEGRPVDPA